MTIKGLLKLITFSFVVVGLSTPAIAVEVLTIKDSAGFTRAESSVEETGRIEFDVTTESGAAANGSEVTIVNAATGESFTTYATEGKAIFDAIPPGVYTVSSPDLGLTFTTVTIGEGSAALGGTLGGSFLGGVTSTTVVGGALGAAAIAGGAIAISESNDDSDDPLSASE